LLNKEEVSNNEEYELEDGETDRRIHKGPLYKICYKECCKLLTKIWAEVMKLTLNDDLYKKCLVFIPEHVMDHLTKESALKLTDFYVESYNSGLYCIIYTGVFIAIF